MTLEESVQHVVMEAIQEVGGGIQCDKEPQGSGHLQGRGSWAQTGSALVRSGLLVELSWSDFPVSCVCQLQVTT